MKQIKVIAEYKFVVADFEVDTLIISGCLRSRSLKQIAARGIPCTAKILFYIESKFYLIICIDQSDLNLNIVNLSSQAEGFLLQVF